MAPMRLARPHVNDCWESVPRTYPTIEMRKRSVATMAPPAKAARCLLVKASVPWIEQPTSTFRTKDGRRKEKGYARETSNQRMTDNTPESRIPRSDMATTQTRTGRQQQNRGRWKMKYRMPRPMVSSLLWRGAMCVSLGGFGIDNDVR